MLAGHAHAFLRVDGAGVGALVGAQEDIFELHHAGVGEKQGLVATGHQRAGWDSGVAMLDEEIDKILADLRSS